MYMFSVNMSTIWHVTCAMRKWCHTHMHARDVRYVTVDAPTHALTVDSEETLPARNLPQRGYYFAVVDAFITASGV